MVVYRKLRGMKPTLADLAEVMPELAQGLSQTLQYTGDVAEDFDLRFDLDVEEWGQAKTVELKPGGSDIVVTKENRQGVRQPPPLSTVLPAPSQERDAHPLFAFLSMPSVCVCGAEYVDLYVDYMLTKSVKKQFDAFKRGFVKVCGGPALELFLPAELELLICGSEVKKTARAAIRSVGVDLLLPPFLSFGCWSRSWTLRLWSRTRATRATPQSHRQ